VAQDLYAYTGTEERSYPQYMDVTPDIRGNVTQRPLEAVPGRSYAITVVPGWVDAKGNPLLPVPPGDGQWADLEKTGTRRKGGDA
jgi:hypothetical protein